MAVVAVNNVLDMANKRHGFLGGYDFSLLGGTRTTTDVDALVGEDPHRIREILLAADKRLSVSHRNKLELGLLIVIELLRGGADAQLKLPDPNNVPLMHINPSEVESGRLNRKGDPYVAEGTQDDDRFDEIPREAERVDATWSEIAKPATGS
ncbi:hypothetical protein AJ79_07062 [Helicocarpus griseus UAMH5409]|uniref:Uncharacterized protein n=1 Tax=Helicocarpus griseus UAMH5409 TaxID=1447875 RepID=A0A2B7X638_9EURO|nr:hypothetical protein AJ79_07062 [Helicocarpus griseus UAMH5409]